VTPGPVRVLLLARCPLDAAVADAPDADLAAAAVPFFVAALGVPPPDGVGLRSAAEAGAGAGAPRLVSWGQRQRNPSANAGLEG